MGTIDRLKVTNFQSIADADIELGQFTVIVGPSNSGKSALLRALKAAVRNASGHSAVRAGQTLFTSQIAFDGCIVALERGKGNGGTYRVITPEGEDVFTKSNRGVPEEVQRIVGLPDPDGPDMVFSTQIDPPFLLAETGSAAAKVIGDLTNVSRLHAAAREANRRRLEASKVHGIRQSDARACFEKMQNEYSDLHSHKAILTEAREQFDSIQAKGRQIALLEEALSTLEMIETSRAALERSIAELPKVEDIEEQSERAGELLGKRHSILESLEVLHRLAEAEEKVKAEHHESGELYADLEEEFVKALIQFGTCPTCGQDTA